MLRTIFGLKMGHKFIYQYINTLLKCAEIVLFSLNQCYISDHPMPVFGLVVICKQASGLGHLRLPTGKGLPNAECFFYSNIPFI